MNPLRILIACEESGIMRRAFAAGPGTCYHWWEGCPKAEKRGCYQLWARAQAAAGNVPDGPGRAKKPEGGDNG